MAHGWAAVAASAMSRYIVGLQPGRPNWSMVRIAPQPSGLRQAEAYVSTPNGRVRVAWTDNDAEFDLTVEIPDGLEYELILPYSGEMRVADRKGVLRRIVIK
jgi:alpha-L-rhamnosidase